MLLTGTGDSGYDLGDLVWYLLDIRDTDIRRSCFCMVFRSGDETSNVGRDGRLLYSLYSDRLDLLFSDMIHMYPNHPRN